MPQVEAVHERGLWKCQYVIEKFWGDDTTQDPYEVLHVDGNLLLGGGSSCLWECLIGNGTATAGGALTYFNASQAAIGVGDSTTAESVTQTDLQAATNKLRKAMNGTFPSHTDGTGTAAQTIQFQSTFATTDANFAWQEAGVFNSATAGTGRMLNRKVTSMGTKTSASSWQITFSITVS